MPPGSRRAGLTRSTGRAYTGSEVIEMPALILTFPCGRCGRLYSVYYPKAIVFPLNGSGTREAGAREDEADGASLEALRRRAEQAGRTWVNAGEATELTCRCGKRLRFDLNLHPRVATTRTAAERQGGVIEFRRDSHEPERHGG